MTKCLLSAIHDVSPRFEGEVDRLSERIVAATGSNHMALLAIPDHWGGAPIRAGTPFATRLRRWSETGGEVFLHGWFHRDTATHRGWARFKARHMTAGEGEFLGVSRAEAQDRLTRGRALLEDIIGQRVRGFVAPAWLYSSGARAALRDLDFDLAEDHRRIWSPADGDRQVAGGTVITWASRSALRRTSSLAAAAVLRRWLRSAPVVRVAVHPGDLRSTALLHSIDRTLVTLAKDRQSASYASLLYSRP